MSMVLYITVWRDISCPHHVETLRATSLQKGFPNSLFQYTYGVGFGIAYPRLEGNAKAYRSGMSDEFRFPRFFYVDSWL